MAQTIRFRLDDDAVDAVAALRARLAATGIAVPSTRPAVTVAAATTIPAPARAAVAAELRLLALPSIWLATLGTVAGRPDELVLAAVVDAELLAVHAAVHDALAGRVKGPVAAYLPGTWLPHCVLATAEPGRAFAELHPITPVRARVVELVDGDA
ncbi:2'-5' RNA ligase family protein [Pseudonocardia sp. GCM10023141]|uniref:2'-5' RNA ligase family protein n=1 Tax=Pseudonocardia sp. GCM10023141 TaxID=3252653 RepID=UPI00360D64FB